jgi:hypothetical protein
MLSVSFDGTRCKDGVLHYRTERVCCGKNFYMWKCQASAKNTKNILMLMTICEQIVLLVRQEYSEKNLLRVDILKIVDRRKRGVINSKTVHLVGGTEETVQKMKEFIVTTLYKISSSSVTNIKSCL